MWGWGWGALLSPNLQTFQFIQSAKGPEGENKPSPVIKKNLLLDSGSTQGSFHPVQRGANKRRGGVAAQGGPERPVMSRGGVCVPVNSQQQTIGGQRLGPVKGLASNTLVWVLVVVTHFQEVTSRVCQQSEEIDARVH